MTILYTSYAIQSLEDILQSKARSLSERTLNPDFSPPFIRSLQGNIKLTLNHMDKQREVLKSMLQTIRYEEFYTYIELERLLRPQESQIIHGERIEILRSRLRQAARDRNNVKATNQGLMRELLDRLNREINEFESVQWT